MFLIIDALLSMLGLAVIVGFIYTAYAFKTKTVMAEEWRFLGHRFNIESSKGEEFIFTIKRI